MKYLLGLIIVLFIVGGAWAQEPDYKQLYMEQRIAAIKLEMRITQLQYRQMQKNLLDSQQALVKYKKEKVEEAKEEEKVEPKKEEKL